MTINPTDDRHWTRTAPALAQMFEQAWSVLDLAAVDALQAELDLLDGYARATMHDGMPTGSRDPLNDLTPVERIAHGRHLIATQLQQIRDDRDAVRQVIQSYVHTLRRAIELRNIAITYTDARLCDGSGLEGADIPYRRYSHDPDNGWLDPQCRDIADDSGLCPRCKVRERRWRQRNGLPFRDTNHPEDTR